LLLLALLKRTTNSTVGGRDVARHDQSSGAKIGSVSEALLSPYPDCTATQKAQIQTVINGAKRRELQVLRHASVHAAGHGRSHEFVSEECGCRAEGDRNEKSERMDIGA
jgi:hypothetical protein